MNKECLVSLLVLPKTAFFFPGIKTRLDTEVYKFHSTDEKHD